MNKLHGLPPGIEVCRDMDGENGRASPEGLDG